MNYKVALAIDANDYASIAPAICEMAEHGCAPSYKAAVETPDCTYDVLYWDNASWDAPEVSPLLDKLKDMHHAFITIDEEHDIVRDFKSWDSRGTDEEFDEILEVQSGIAYCDFGKLNATPLTKHAGDSIPISRERLLALLRDYMSWDQSGGVDERTFYETLIAVGFCDEEIEALGFGSCIPEEPVKTGIPEIILAEHPELVGNDCSFPEKKCFDIGFINPHIENWQGDGIANDETQLEAESLFDLVSLYIDFCKENALPYNTVKYVDLVEAAEESEAREFKEGDRVRLLRMPKDPRPVPPMMEGTVKCIDGAGHIHIEWDNGRRLALIPGVDRFVSVPASKEV